MFWRREKSLVPAGIQTLDHPPHSLITTPTVLKIINMIIYALTVLNLCTARYNQMADNRPEGDVLCQFVDITSACS
jgi:hypothetical protein